jgi:hypothetical protein
MATARRDSAPLHTLLLLGVATTVTTVAAGALIVVAGVLVVAFGSAQRGAVAMVPT